MKIVNTLLVILSIVCVFLSAAPFTSAIFLSILLMCVAGIYGFYHKTNIALFLLCFSTLAIIASPWDIAVINVGYILIPYFIGFGGTILGLKKYKVSELISSINNDIIEGMDSIAKIVKEMKANSKGVRFNDLQKVCEFYFGKVRQTGSSHCIYKTPWSGDPRVNIQNSKGKAKSYQVKQVLRAIEQIEVKNGS